MEDLEATPRRVIDLNNQNFFHGSSPSLSPSPSPSRLWRTAAQRNIRNQWSKLLSAKDRWLSASSDGKSYGTSLVNAFLSQRFMLHMDLGVLKDMPAIREKACEKLAYQQDLGQSALLSSYKEMLLAVSQMVKASKSMRCYLKGSVGSPILQFCDRPDVVNDAGDGAGVPVFLFFPVSFSVSDFEKLAEELVAMFVLELALKRLLVVELTSMQLEKETDKYGTSIRDKELFEGEFNELRFCGLLSDESCEILTKQTYNLVSLSSLGHEASETVLQVYLTSWLANVNLNWSRIDEIFMVVEETMQVKL